MEIEYPPPYARDAWDYEKDQTDLVSCSIDQSDWVNLFLDKNIDKQVIFSINHERLAIKLNDLEKAPKPYWPILKTFVNASKIPLIPPLLVKNEFVTGFLFKENLFNNFSREQCRPITDDGFLPNNQTIETVTRLSDINIDT